MNCPGECVTLECAASFDLQGTFGGTATLSVNAFPGSSWINWGTTVEATAQAGVQTGASVSGGYNLAGCQTSPSGFTDGEICIAQVDGLVTAAFVIFGEEFTFTATRTLISGNCW